MNLGLFQNGCTRELAIAGDICQRRICIDLVFGKPEGFDGEEPLERQNQDFESDLNAKWRMGKRESNYR